MQQVHNIHESYGDYTARIGSRKIWYAVLGTMMVLIGFFGGGSNFILHQDFGDLLLAIFFILAGAFLVWLWFKRQDFYNNYFRRRNKAPITRVSYG